MKKTILLIIILALAIIAGSCSSAKAADTNEARAILENIKYELRDLCYESL